MICSKPSDRPVLDHDIVIGKNEEVYVVVGNLHPPNGIIAYLKYVACEEPTLWKRKGIWLKRILKKYGAKNMYITAKKSSKIRYDPVLGTEVPFVSWAEIKEWLRPESRLQQLLHSLNDPLEAVTLMAAERISISSGVKMNRIGVTGSILLGAHNPKRSDVNLVIYGCEEALEVVSGGYLSLDKLPASIMDKRLRNQSMITGLPIDILKVINPPYRFRAIDKIPVGIIFVNPTASRYGQAVYKPIGKVEAIVYVEGGSCSSLFYPAKAPVMECLNVKGPILCSSLKEIICYEGIYNWLLFKGGYMEVKGIAEVRYPGEDIVIVVGGKEVPGYIIPH